MRRGRLQSCHLILVLALVVFASGLRAQEAPQVSLTITLRPGPPIGETPEQAAAKTPPTTAFRSGEPVDVTFTITNEGDESYTYTDRLGDRSGRMDEYELRVVDILEEEGPRITALDPRVLGGNWWRGGGLSTERTLAPGQSFTKHVYLNQWVMPLSPGPDTVVGIYHVNPLGWPKEPSVQSEPVRIEVRPWPEAELKAYIDGLGRELRSDDRLRRQQAIRYLGFTGSTLALPHLTAALYDPYDPNAFWASEAFLYMRDREACVAALQAARRDRGPATRLQELLTHYNAPP